MPDTDRLINKAQGDDIITALNGITSRLQEMYTVDDALSSTSEHPVQNKVVKGALDNKADESDLADKADKSDISSTQTVSGNPLILTDCAPINAESLVVELEPKQEGSGDPSPTNIRPITGYTQTSVEGCGYNRLDYDDWKQSTIANGTGTWENNGVTLTATANDCFTYSSDYEKGEVSVNNGDSVKISWEENTNANGTIYAFDQNGNILGVTNNNASKALNVTIGSGVSKIRFRFGVDASGVTIAYKNIMVQVNTNESTYSPYVSTSATIQFGQTVYGAEVDFGGGTESTKTKIKISDLTPYGCYNGTNATCLVINLSDASTTVNYDQYHGAISDSLMEQTAYYGWQHPSDAGLPSMPFFGINSDGTLLTIYDEDTTLNQSQMLAKYGDTEVCYPLATSEIISTPRTPLKLLKGTNNLTTNGTTIQLGYQPDNVIGEVKGEIQQCIPAPYYMTFDVDSNITDVVPIIFDQATHDYNIVGDGWKDKTCLCIESVDMRMGTLQRILSSDICFVDSALKNILLYPYIRAVGQNVELSIIESSGTYKLSYRSTADASATDYIKFRVRVFN